jgi:signal transduction histidine kinase
MNDMLHSTLKELGALKVDLASEESKLLPLLIKEADHLSKARICDIPSCLLEFDKLRMEQVIGNIIDNSYKYAGTDIDVDFQLREDVLQVDIQDYGRGVGPDELELIFTKFYRGENAIASQKGGTGLGLYIAKQLMEKMDGGLEAFNLSGGFGIRLWIQLSK